MPDNNKRVDLSGELEQISGSLLDDIQAATAQVKSRQASDKAKEAKEAQKTQSKKMSAVVIAASTVILLLLSYWVVFGRSSSDASSVSYQAAQPQAPSTKINTPAVTTNAPKAPPVVAAPIRQQPQTVQHPPDGYEQPSDSGM